MARSRQLYALPASVDMVEAFPKPVPAREPVQLREVQWGVRDEALARVVCRHLVDANPPIEIPFNPLTESRVRRALRSLCLHH